jgi:hypothetical protein
VHLGHWLPDTTPSLVVFDPNAVSDLDPPSRVRVFDAFKRMTVSGGIHCFIPVPAKDAKLAAAVLRAHYGDWSTQHRYTDTPGWFLAIKP